MKKAGIPIEGIKSLAQRELRTDNVDFLLSLLTSTDKVDEIKESSSQDYFKPLKHCNNVEFMLTKNNDDRSQLAWLVQKMVLTVNKGRVSIRNELGQDTILTASLQDLYNALGAL